MDFPDSAEFIKDPIQFHKENIDFDFPNSQLIRFWIVDSIQNEQKKLVSLNFIFCNDSYLHKINVAYLNHDTLTDVITFPYSDDDAIEGDIYISIDRIKENAKKFNVPFLQELKRVIIHGVLHLCGHGDKNKKEQKKMRKKENFYLDRFNNQKKGNS